MLRLTYRLTEAIIIASWHLFVHDHAMHETMHVLSCLALLAAGFSHTQDYHVIIS